MLALVTSFMGIPRFQITKSCFLSSCPQLPTFAELFLHLELLKRKHRSSCHDCSHCSASGSFGSFNEIKRRRLTPAKRTRKTRVSTAKHKLLHLVSCRHEPSVTGRSKIRLLSLPAMYHSILETRHLSNHSCLPPLHLLSSH